MKVPKKIYNLSLALAFASSAYAQEHKPLFTFFKPEIRIDSISVFKKPIIKKFSIESLPFFCKMEEKLAAKSNMNFRFRVGNLDYVNKLEGK